MVLKDTWVDGEVFTTASVNAVATQVNANTTAITGKQASDADLTAIAALTPSNDDVIQRKAGAWTNRTVSQLRADLDQPSSIFNVKAYGAVGDGTTIDSTAFGSAIAAAVAAGGGVVLVPAGTYMVSNIRLASKVVLRGSGMGVTILKFDASSADTLVVRVSASSVTAASFVGLENLTIDGNMSTIGSSNVNKRYGYYLGVTSPTVVSDCWVDRVEFKACKSYALDILGDGGNNVSRVTVSNCVSHDNGFSSGTNNNSSGFECHADNVVFVNCFAYGNANHGFFAGNGEAHSRVKMMNCIATTSGQAGFVIGEDMIDSSVIGGASYSNTKWGIYIGPDAHRAVVSGCSIYSNTWNGIDVEDSNNCVISGNILNGNVTAGSDDEIKLEGSTNSTLITGNQILSGATNKAIHEYNTTDATYIVGNMVALPMVIIGAHSGARRITSLTSTATPGANTDQFDEIVIPALATNITGFSMSGTPIPGQTLWVSITGTATRTIVWGSSFEASGAVALPTTTSGTTRLDVGFKWNPVTSKWRCVAVS